MTDSRQLMPAEAAAAFVAILEARGAVFTLNGEYFHADLDSIPLEAMPCHPDVLACAVLAFGDEITTILRSRAVLH